MNNELVIPSEIPWDNLKGRDLEECLYWLLNAMGFKDIEWRIGGSGPGAADQGRDLEACFYMDTPDGELNRQKWWIETKGRSKSVPPADVKNAITNTASNVDIDILVIATNSTFSNPTRNWVKDWQSSHPRPQVRLWDRHNLEKLVCENPNVAVRLFSQALSPQGRLEVVRLRFWEYSHYASETTLKHIWTHREELKFSPPDILALQGSEFANGDIEKRPWGLLFETTELLSIFSVGLLNTLYFCIRSEDAGSNQKPYIQSMAYLLLLILDQLNATAAFEVLQKAWNDSGKFRYTKDIRNIVIGPILEQLRSELRDVCTSDCRRVIMDPVELGRDGIESYWKRLKLSPESQKAKNEPVEFLIIEDSRASCKIGFEVGKRHSCPIAHWDNDRSLEEKLVTLKHLVDARRPSS